MSVPPQLDEFFAAGEAPLRATEFAELGWTEETIWSRSNYRRRLPGNVAHPPLARGERGRWLTMSFAASALPSGFEQVEQAQMILDVAPHSRSIGKGTVGEQAAN